MQLSAELVDQIIDHLHDDFPTLKICGAVCKTWTATSRFHLFSRIKLDNSRVSSLHELLSVQWTSFPRHIPHIVFEAYASRSFDISHLRTALDYILSIQHIRFTSFAFSRIPTNVLNCVIAFLQKAEPSSIILMGGVFLDSRQLVNLLSSCSLLRKLSIGMVHFETDKLDGTDAFPEDVGQELTKHISLSQLEATDEVVITN